MTLSMNVGERWQPVDSRRILIIDDNVELADNIAEILQMDGHVAEVAISAEEALSKVHPSRPDVVVTDYRLPGMNGADLVRQLGRMGLRVRAIVMSAYTDQPTIEDARDAGAVFVPKPIDFEDLGRAIRDHDASG
jgi:two-component system response regulator (stage 0 sporulation protein F)